MDGVLPSLAYSNSSDNPPASVQINWTFSDGNSGAQGAGGVLSVVGSTTVTINGINDPPIAQNDGAMTDEDTLKLIDVLGNDTDVDGGSLSVLGLSATALGATVSIVDGQVQYDPTSSAALDALGPGSMSFDSFSYTITDGLGGTATALVTVNVLGL